MGSALIILLHTPCAHARNLVAVSLFVSLSPWVPPSNVRPMSVEELLRAYERVGGEGEGDREEDAGDETGKAALRVMWMEEFDLSGKQVSGERGGGEEGREGHAALQGQAGENEHPATSVQADESRGRSQAIGVIVLTSLIDGLDLLNNH